MSRAKVVEQHGGWSTESERATYGNGSIYVRFGAVIVRVQEVDSEAPFGMMMSMSSEEAARDYMRSVLLLKEKRDDERRR